MSFIMMLSFVIFFPVMESALYKETPLQRMIHVNRYSEVLIYHWSPVFQCPKRSECLCKETYRGFYYNCDLLIFAEMKEDKLKVYCNHTVGRRDIREKIHLLSEIVQHSVRSLELYDCPASSISDFLFPASIKESEVHCKERKDLDLTMDSFRNLSRLGSMVISCGSIMRLPKDIFQIQSTVLNTLVIENTMINRLEPDVFSNLSQLTDLMFRNNTILKLSKTDFMGLQNLDLLVINKYPSVELEDDLFDPIPNIVFLTFSESGFKKLPRSFQRLQNLKHLKILQTSLEWMDEDSCKLLKKITYLQLNSNPFLDMHPNCMKYLNDTAEGIVLEGNQISILPTYTVKMKRLLDFTFSNNGHSHIQTVKNFISSDTLQTLKMRNSSIHSIHEDFLRRLPNIRDIDLSDNKLSYLNENFFEYNMELSTVKLSRNNLIYIPVSLFKKKPYLVYVDLSLNNISEINFNLTENLTSLKNLNLSFNKIQLLPRKPFSNMPNTEFLDISNKNISVIDSVAFQVMRKLSELRMGGNKMNGRFFPFSNTFESLKYLSAECNSFTEILWLNMPSLLKLNLANNLIVNLDFKVFDSCKYIVELNLSRNRIETLPYRISTEIRKLISLDLSFNRLKNIPGKPDQTYFSTLQLEFLDLSGNDMETFYMERISTPTGIRKVSVRSSNISVLYCYTRLNEHILVLDFSYNRISSKMWPWYYDMPLKSSGRVSPFVRFGYLEELYLAHNQITDIPIDFRIHHPHLKVLDLSFNKIKRLTHQELLFFPYSFDRYGNAKPYDCCHTLTVDLRNNLIGTVDLPHSMLLRNVTRKCDKHKYSHATILLGHNPFECGCKVIPFLRVVEEDVILASELWRTKGKDWLLQAKINTENLICSSPESVNGKLVIATETWLHHLLPTIGFCHLSENKDHIEFN